MKLHNTNRKQLVGERCTNISTHHISSSVLCLRTRRYAFLHPSPHHRQSPTPFAPTPASNRATVMHVGTPARTHDTCSAGLLVAWEAHLLCRRGGRCCTTSSIVSLVTDLVILVLPRRSLLQGATRTSVRRSSSGSSSRCGSLGSRSRRR